jgi:integrase
MRALNRLSPAAVKHAGPGMHADGGGLWLQAIGDARSWIFRWVRGGAERKIGLGSLAVIGLAAARQRAAECRRLLAEGTDPLQHREAQKAAAALGAAKALTFDQAAKQYIAAHRASWKNPVHAEQWPSTLKKWCSPVFGHLPVQAVDTQLVLKALQQDVDGKPFWEARTETARKVRGRVEAVLSWAKAQRLRSGDNPAARESLKHLLPDRADVAVIEHHAAMPYRDVPAYVADLRARKSVSALALEFTILSCLRTSEVILTPWSEIEAAADGVWTIPPPRMKGRRKRPRAHRVPLTRRMLEIVEEMKAYREGDYLFPGGELGEPLSKMAMLELLQGTHPDLTVHGFRSSFKDWAVEQTSFPDFVSEVALAHVSSDKVRKAYKRSDLIELRRKLTGAWEAWCSGEAKISDLAKARARRQVTA